MRAAILDRGRVQVGEFPDPTPITGQVLVRTRRCALYASDAHFLTSGATIVERSKRNNGPYAGVDLSKPIVMGHEYVGEILDYGPGSRRPLPVGALVTSIPGLRTPSGFGIVGYYHECPGGYGE
jgi:threonine dehydrogenase-like Zn-dependent dehydrogenase